jgi:hypothetical protein
MCVMSGACGFLLPERGQKFLGAMRDRLEKRDWVYPAITNLHPHPQRANGYQVTKGKIQRLNLREPPILVYARHEQAKWQRFGKTAPKTGWNLLHPNLGWGTVPAKLDLEPDYSDSAARLKQASSRYDQRKTHCV